MSTPQDIGKAAIYSMTESPGNLLGQAPAAGGKAHGIPARCGESGTSVELPGTQIKTQMPTLGHFGQFGGGHSRHQTQVALIVNHVGKILPLLGVMGP